MSVMVIPMPVLPFVDVKVAVRFEIGTAIILIPLNILFDSLVKVCL
jgi:hypothetical protein